MRVLYQLKKPRSSQGPITCAAQPAVRSAPATSSPGLPSMTRWTMLDRAAVEDRQLKEIGIGYDAGQRPASRNGHLHLPLQQRLADLQIGKELPALEQLRLDRPARGASILPEIVPDDDVALVRRDCLERATQEHRRRRGAGHAAQAPPPWPRRKPRRCGGTMSRCMLLLLFGSPARAHRLPPVSLPDCVSVCAVNKPGAAQRMRPMPDSDQQQVDGELELPIRESLRRHAVQTTRRAERPERTREISSPAALLSTMSGRMRWMAIRPTGCMQEYERLIQAALACLVPALQTAPDRDECAGKTRKPAGEPAEKTGACIGEADRFGLLPASANRSS